MAFAKFFVLMALCAVCYAEDEFPVSPGLPGGLHEANQNAEGFADALNVAMNEINKLPSLGNSKLTLKQIINAREQVVAGLMRHLTLHVVPTGCQKTAAASEKCEAVPGHAGYRCFVKVVSVPWQNKVEVTDEIDCKPM